MSVSLIEQLGGYNIVKRMWVDGGSLQDTQLAFELLEYRREHNIYEVGDWIIILSDTVKKEWEFYQLTEDDIGSHWINLVEFRHATTEEIQAGRRL